MSTTLKPTGQPVEKLAPLWGEIEIPIVVTTGEYGQGKTLFGLTICPGPSTLVFDNEGSSLTYRSLDFDHVDMAVELTKKHPKGYTPQDRFLWFRDEALRRGREGGRAGKYRVLVIDPASELEDGLADYVKQNITKFGLTANQAERSPALFWGVMKREWKALLDQLRVLYETVYITVHLRDEFRGGAPTGKREPKGKETLMELASLSLWFEREKDKAGNVSAVPSATVLKSRLAKTLFADGEVKVVPVLPPRLPVATPKAIREYIATPPDYDHLKKNERVVEKQLSEDEKLLIQAKMAENQAIAAQAESSRLDKIASAAKAQATAQEAVRPAPDQAAMLAAHKADQAAERVEPASTEQITELMELISQSFATEQEAREVVPGLLAAQGVERLAHLNRYQAEAVKGELLTRKAGEQVRRAGEKLAATGTVAQHDPLPIQDATAEEIRGMLGRAFTTSEECNRVFGGMLQSLRCQKISQLTESQGHHVIAGLNRVIEERTARESAGPAPVGEVTREELLALQDLCEAKNFGHAEQAKWLTEHKLGSFRSLSRAQYDELVEHLNETPF